MQTAYDIRLIIASIFQKGNFDGMSVYGMKDIPSEQDYRRVTKQLIKEHKLSRDMSFHSNVYRVNDVEDGDAENICCLVDQFCNISHLSAMERYGLTDKIPKRLYITRLKKTVWNKRIDLIIEHAKKEFANFISGFDKPISLTYYTFPEKVRDRNINVLTTKSIREFVSVRNEYSRISTIGQTFADMLLEPQLCGGMSHVLDVWENEIQSYLEDVVNVIEKNDSSILKVRAGFILDERLRIKHKLIESWKNYAQRGGSRRLDSSKPYIPTFSEKWMISINS